MSEDWSKQFNSLLSSPLGKELIDQLTLIKRGLQDDASNADTQESSYAFTQQARGVIKAIEHLQFLSVVSTGEGSKVKY